MNILLTARVWTREKDLKKQAYSQFNAHKYAQEHKLWTRIQTTSMEYKERVWIQHVYNTYFRLCSIPLQRCTLGTHLHGKKKRNKILTPALAHIGSVFSRVVVNHRNKLNIPSNSSWSDGNFPNTISCSCSLTHAGSRWDLLYLQSRGYDCAN